MSRRTNPVADKAAQNQQVIKSLLKLPGNKVCADCKRNKLPRWASWNLGVFICIRCSGIHRGMGTHISRVKSVDLDSWTDEQLQSMLKWGNSRANKYWEANLAQGHIPSEAKIENFVRTKYESKRWVMEGGMPDPSTLEDSGEEDNLPLKVVQQKLENRQISPPPQQFSSRQHLNLMEDGELSPQLQRSTSVPPTSRSQPPPKGSPAPPKSTKPADSLLGLDFFGTAPSPTPRPASVNSNPVSNTSASRPDLNRSILSLYASKPQPRFQHADGPSVSSPQQPSLQQGPSSGLADLNDVFGNFGFGQPPTQQSVPPPPKPSPFANLTAGMMKSSAAPQLSPASTASTGGFFGSANTGLVSKKHTPSPSFSTATSGLEDLFGFSPTPSAPVAPPPPPMSSVNSFSPQAPKPATTQLSFGTNAWATPSPVAPTVTSNESVWGTSAANGSSSPSIWGTSTTSTTMGTSNPATVGLGNLGGRKSEDDEWGDFSTVGTGAGTAASATAKTGGFGDDDLFGNVWK